MHGLAHYYEYTLGTDLRNASRAMFDAVVEANASADRAPRLLELQGRLEQLKVTVRLCHDAGGFARRRLPARGRDPLALWLPPVVAADPAAAPIMRWPYRTPRGARPNLRQLLASKGLPVAWIAETGRRDTLGYLGMGL